MRPLRVLRHLVSLLAGGLLLAGPVAGQDASPVASERVSPVGRTADVVAGGDPVADLWLVGLPSVTASGSHPGLIERHDGATGTLLAAFAPEVPGCVFTRVVGATPDGIWVIDTGYGYHGRPATSVDPAFTPDPASPGAVPGSGREARCIAWFPFDGSAPTVTRIPEPAGWQLDVLSAAVAGSGLWFGTVTDGVEIGDTTIPEYALWHGLPGAEATKAAADVLWVAEAGGRIWAFRFDMKHPASVLSIDPADGKATRVKAVKSPQLLSAGEGNVVTERYVTTKRGGHRVVDVLDATTGKKRASIALDDPYLGLGNVLVSPDVLWARTAGRTVGLFAVPIKPGASPVPLAPDCSADNSCVYWLLQADADGLWAAREQSGPDAGITLEHWTADTLARDVSLPIRPGLGAR